MENNIPAIILKLEAVASQLPEGDLKNELEVAILELKQQALRPVKKIPSHPIPY